METYGNLKDTLTGAVPEKEQEEKTSETKNIKKSFFISEIKKNNNNSPKNQSKTINCEQKRTTLPLITTTPQNKRVKGFNHYYKVINLLEKKRNDFKQIVYRNIYNYYNILGENTINTANIEFTNNFLNNIPATKIDEIIVEIAIPLAPSKNTKEKLNTTFIIKEYNDAFIGVFVSFLA